jgi:2-dehydropantoate 2-reductase
MRYVIIGAGAIGGTIAARLAQHSKEHPPLVIARGEHGRVLAAEGLRLRTADEDVRIPVEVAATPEEVRLASDDVLVVATKTHQVQAALEQWADAPVFSAPDATDAAGTAGELLPVLLALNGVASERIALRYFDRVFGVCVWLPAVHLEPGEVVLRIAPVSGSFIVGRYAAPADDADAALLATVKQDWEAASFHLHVVDDVMRWKHLKLLGNLGNALQALLGPDAEYGAIIEAIRAEARDVYLAAGIEWAGDDEEAVWRGKDFAIRAVPGVEGELGGSSWQSMARGSGSIETDYLNGEIAYLARSLGRTAPLNAAVQRIARQAAANGRKPGEITVAELERAVGITTA